MWGIVHLAHGCALFMIVVSFTNNPEIKQHVNKQVTQHSWPKLFFILEAEPAEQLVLAWVHDFFYRNLSK